MRPMILILAAGTGLLACNGGSDTDTVSTTETPQASVGEQSAAATTANEVRETIDALSRPGSGGGSTTAPPSRAKDPGPRDGPAGAGDPFATLTPHQRIAFDAGKEDFEGVENVEDGLGPTMNLDSCGGCHSQPSIGGTSPPVNPQVAFATKDNATNKVPSFITANGPVREARFVRNADGSPDGGVHALFTIAGRSDASGCKVAQPDFEAQVARRNVVFRIPTPLFGAGLIESIPDSEILKNQATAGDSKRSLGIRGRPNLLLPSGAIFGKGNKNGNDGTTGRFGHKAQNKSLLIFSGEAYNVEMGITNGAFPTEREESEGCIEQPMPNDDATLDAPTAVEALSSIERFTLFMRFLAPPTPSTTQPGGADSINRGREAFGTVGCALCHTPSLKTYNAAVPALRYQVANLYSDLLLHDMGRGLADGIQQGQAGGRDFRTAPLWGLGQRLFFLHDGRTSDLRQAILEHSSDGSEANEVTRRFFNLPDAQQQDLLNFLRSL